MFAELTWALMILTFFIVFGFVGVILYFGKLVHDSNNEKRISKR